MDMNKAFFLRKEDRAPQWHVIDAQNKILGRLATQVADILSGKTKTNFAPHTDNGDYVVIINAKDIALSGTKMDQKIYTRVSGWIGGKKEILAKDVHRKDPTRLIHLAVKGMLPKNSLAAVMLTRLRIYEGSDHPHTHHV